ncbi:hypothetical protein CLF_109126 [Clonorchis sinensis]|uniref:Uncharacterized protein n=1 Tax=Clonorchis sinensis TaxID=79923 RepID=H2KSF1_CLOSI|nr:hypothetical protein CLF_109126 [Clonorchis sinensis]
MDVDAAKQWSLDWGLVLNDEKHVRMSYTGDSANAFVVHDRKKDVTLIKRVQRAATKMVAGLKNLDYGTRITRLDHFPGVSSPPRPYNTYTLFEQGLANRTFIVDPTNTRGGHDERNPLNDKKPDSGSLGESIDTVYQAVERYPVNTIGFVGKFDSDAKSKKAVGKQYEKADANRYCYFAQPLQLNVYGTYCDGRV